MRRLESFSIEELMGCICTHWVCWRSIQMFGFTPLILHCPGSNRCHQWWMNLFVCLEILQRQAVVLITLVCLQQYTIYIGEQKLKLIIWSTVSEIHLKVREVSVANHVFINGDLSISLVMWLILCLELQGIRIFKRCRIVLRRSLKISNAHLVSLRQTLLLWLVQLVLPTNGWMLFVHRLLVTIKFCWT